MTEDKIEFFEIFPWDSNFETGITEIDEQHKRLVDILNHLAAHLANRSHPSTLNHYFDQLAEYADYHFKSEEQIWRDTLGEDAWFKKHQQNHSSFIDNVVTLRKEEGKKTLDEVIQDIVSFLSKWLAYHILDEDKRLSIVVDRVTAGYPLEEAKQIATDKMSGSMQLLIDTVLTMYEQLSFRTMDIMREKSLRKQAETALLRAKEEAENANQSKSIFLASMSHEIRTPMNGVIGMLDVLSHSTLAADDRKMLESIRRSANSLLGVINDILDFSKIEAGKLSIESHPLELREVSHAVIQMLTEIAANQQVDLEYTLAANIPTTVQGDTLRIQQILTNLINNAIKFSASEQQRGRVLLRIENTKEESHEIWVRFTVEDNGIGMSEEVLKRLFKPYEQADSSTTQRYGGTGLGLLITHNLVEMMGGKITVTSQPGQGSRFQAEIPFQPSAAPSTTTAIDDLSGLDAILLSDNNNQLADQLWQTLQLKGLQLQQVGSVAETIELLCSDFPFSSPLLLLNITDESFIETFDEGLDEKQRNRIIGIQRSMEQGDETRKERTTTHDHWIELEQAAFEQGELIPKIIQRIKEYRGLKTTEQLQPLQQESSTTEDTHTDEPLILVAEDNEINRDVISRQLSLLGYRYELACDGLEVLEKFQSMTYMLILTDLHMPNMDGYTLTAKVREIEQSEDRNHTPIIAITANALKDEEERCRSLGMDGYLSKPLTLKSLQEELEHWR